MNKLTLACIITSKTLTEGVSVREDVQVRHWQRTQRSRHFPCVNAENGRDQRKSVGAGAPWGGLCRFPVLSLVNESRDTDLSNRQKDANRNPFSYLTE